MWQINMIDFKIVFPMENTSIYLPHCPIREKEAAPMIVL